MAHELDFSNGRPAMAYIGFEPWHGFGRAMTPDADAETWKREAGMDWVAKSAPVEFATENKLGLYPDRQVLYRSDNGEPLSIVSNRFKVVQPGMMIDFFGNLIEKHGFTMETAGCLFGGRVFWALARTGNNVSLAGGDNISPYAMIVSSVDGEMSTAVHLTTIRVVCWNTLSMAVGETGKKAVVTVPHNKIFHPREAQIKAGLVEETWETFVKNASILTGIKIDRETALDIVVKNMKSEWKDKDGNKLLNAEVEESSYAIRKIMSLYTHESIGNNLVSSKDTAWGLVNAVTQYCDHDAGRVNTDRSRTFVRTHLGDRATFKIKVANSLLELAK